jgi:hypothetical protein
MKSFIIVAGVAVVGGAVFVGFRHASEVRGDVEPVTLSETYTHAERITRGTLRYLLT